MAHIEQGDFCMKVKSRFPTYFEKSKVLDVGSADVNGNLHWLFDNCVYTGVDIAPFKNVNVVSFCHDLKYPDGDFDIIISTECFEHDPYLALSLKNIVRMLRPAGLLLFTCATTGRPEHGTTAVGWDASPLGRGFVEFRDYYCNVTENLVRTIIDINTIFSSYEFSVVSSHHDLQFWGIKNA